MQLIILIHIPNGLWGVLVYPIFKPKKNNNNHFFNLAIKSVMLMNLQVSASNASFFFEASSRAAASSRLLSTAADGRLARSTGPCQ